MGQITVFSGPERRRRWSEVERLQILAEALSPGARIAEVCRRHDISSGLIYTWRRKLRETGTQTLASAVSEPVFAEAVMDEEAAAGSPGQHPAIIVDLARSKRMSIFVAASPAQIAAALKALR